MTRSLLCALLLCLLPCNRGQSSGDLRLVDNDGNTVGSSGRLEVYYSGLWGTVCDESFDYNAAVVACRQLGYGGVEVYNQVDILGYSEGEDDQPVWLDSLDCEGAEERLEDCSHDGFGDHDCDHGNVVGLSCEDFGIQQGTLRLQGGTRSTGRLEIYVSGQWGTVCDDHFSQLDADVACRQLGYTRGYCWGSVGAFEIPVAPPTTPTWLDNVMCGTSDTSLLYCPHNGVGNEDCSRTEDVAVVCAYSSGCSGFTTASGGGNSYFLYYSGGGIVTLIFFGICCCYFVAKICCSNDQRGRSSRSRRNRRSTTPRTQTLSPSVESRPEPLNPSWAAPPPPNYFTVVGSSAYDLQQNSAQTVDHLPRERGSPVSNSQTNPPYSDLPPPYPGSANQLAASTV